MNKLNSRNFNFGLIFLVAFNLLPHLVDYTLPVIVVGGGCIIWRLLFEYQKVKLPGTFVKSVLIVCSVGWVFMTHKTFLGLEAGTSLMIMAISLKLIDRNRYHDAMIILFVTFLILLTRVLKDQSLWITLFGAVDLIVVTSLLLQLHSHDQLKFNASTFFINGLKLMLQVSPMMILLFIVFPRISNELKLVPAVRKVVSAQLNKDVKPGDLAIIAGSDALAFRARYLDSVIRIPKYKYWRGSVLSYNQGMRWSRPKERPSRDREVPFKKPEGITLDHEVILEPLYGKWLFALDQPLSVDLRSTSPSKLVIEKDGTFSLQSPLTKKILYVAESGQPEAAPLSSDEKEIYLQAPSEKDIRVHFLVSEILNNTDSNIEVANNLLGFFKHQFRYDSNPGKDKTTELGPFIFDKKVGFSEHFAVSFASLMRLAGVPARIVIGFHGGEQNEFDDYITVQEKDIHAWTEIWSEKHQKWVRYDPTMVVDPLRLDLGGQLYHSLTQGQLDKKLSSEEYWQMMQDSSSWSSTSVAKIRSALQSASTRWNLFLLSYDERGQRNFLKKLGLDRLKKISLFLISIMILVLFYLFVRKQFLNKVEESQNEKIFKDLCAYLEKKGLEKWPQEGASTFFQRVSKELSAAESSLVHFKENYILWKYSREEPTQADLKRQKERLQEIIKAV